MNYLNRFLIEEDIQFECAGVVKINKSDRINIFQFELSNYSKRNKLITNISIRIEIVVENEKYAVGG